MKQNEHIPGFLILLTCSNCPQIDHGIVWFSKFVHLVFACSLRKIEKENLKKKKKKKKKRRCFYLASWLLPNNRMNYLGSHMFNCGAVHDWIRASLFKKKIERGFQKDLIFECFPRTCKVCLLFVGPFSHDCPSTEQNAAANEEASSEGKMRKGKKN